MTNSKAQVAKDKGNIAFKSGDYPAAIGNYTEAILADRNDPTFPLNRAAAYLKLGKNEDAERDCTTTLSLNSSNVKALFRRGQARVGMGRLEEAVQGTPSSVQHAIDKTDGKVDFKDASRREPTNDSVKEELRRVSDLIENEKSKKSKSSSVKSIPTPVVSPRRRRIPIKIIDPADTASTHSQIIQLQKSSSPGQGLQTGLTSGQSAETHLLKPVSSRQLNPSSTLSNSASDRTPHPLPIASPITSPQMSSRPKPHTFKDAKQARESTKTSRVGGGIFRASGNNTIFPTREGAAIHTDPLQTKTTSGVKSQLSLFDFTKAWECSSSVEDRWRLISGLPPSSLPAMFKTSLEPSLFVSILEIFLEVISGSEPAAAAVSAVREYMAFFLNVPRFGTVLLLLSREERDTTRLVWKKLGVENPDGIWSTIVS